MHGGWWTSMQQGPVLQAWGGLYPSQRLVCRPEPQIPASTAAAACPRTSAVASAASRAPGSTGRAATPSSAAPLPSWKPGDGDYQPYSNTTAPRRGNRRKDRFSQEQTAEGQTAQRRGSASLSWDLPGSRTGWEPEGATQQPQAGYGRRSRQPRPRGLAEVQQPLYPDVGWDLEGSDAILEAKTIQQAQHGYPEAQWRKRAVGRPAGGAGSSSARGSHGQNAYDGRATAYDGADGSPSLGGSPRQRAQQAYTPAARPRPAPRMSHRERQQRYRNINRLVEEAHERTWAAQPSQTVTPAMRMQALQALVEDLDHIVFTEGHDFDAVNIATALHRLGSAVAEAGVSSSQMGAQCGNLVDQLLSMAGHGAKDFKIQSVVNSVGALAHLQHAADPRVLDALAARALQRLREPPNTQPQMVANLVWAYGKLAFNALDGQLLDAALALAERTVDEYETQHLAQIMLGLAYSGHPVSSKCLDALARALVARMPEAGPQHIANVLWACGALDVDPLDGELFDAALLHAQRQLRQFSIQNLCNTISAVAKVQHPISHELADELAGYAAMGIDRAIPQNVSNLLLAYAKLQHNPAQGQLIGVALRHAMRDLHAYKPQELANTLWALAKLQITPDPELLDAFAAQFQQQLAQATPQNIANTLWAYARMGHRPLQGQLINAAVAQLEQQVQSCSIQHLSNTVLAVGILQQPGNAAAACRLAGAVLQRIQDAKPQELCNVLWALAALDCLNPEWLQLVGSHLESTGTVDSLSGEELSQLWQANMAASRVLSGSEATSSASSRASLLPQSITDRCENSLASGYQPVTVSSFQSQVSAALHQLGIPHFEEYQVDGTPLSVDIVIEAPEGVRIAVEVDGPLHFDTTNQPLGKTVLRNRLLKALGFQGVGVPFFHWAALPTPALQQAYLLKRLAQFGVPASSALPVA